MSAAADSRAGLLLAALAAITASLQGCTLNIPRHDVGNWQKKENYYEEFSYEVPQADDGDRVQGRTIRLNSCADDSIAPSLQCSGHGSCKTWFPEPRLDSNGSAAAFLGPSFCLCDRDWTGPECNIQRKSQLTAFLLSMGLGVFGVDEFYLGWWRSGIAKLFTLGGCGLWWLFDMVRIGSSPVPTSDSFRVASDVEHWAFVLVLLCFLGFVGFGLSIWSIHQQRLQKAKELMVLNLEGGVPMGYGATMQNPNMSAAAWQPQPAGAGFRGYSTTLGGGSAVMRSAYAGSQ